MALSVVNGYLCFSSCDVAKALAGKNPHPSDSPNGADAGGANDPAEGARADQPAVLLSGALAEARTDNSRPAGAARTASTTAPALGSGLDLLA